MLRFLRFNLVGLLGTVLQLAVLKLLTATTPLHYLAASTVALELTLLHNFAWHLRYTWRDRTEANRLHRLLRFHATNGLLSLAANLALLPWLHGALHLPLLLSNTLAIAACGIANFLLTHHWTFAAKASGTLAAAVLLALPFTGHAQTGPVPDAPSTTRIRLTAPPAPQETPGSPAKLPAKATVSHPETDYLYTAALFCSTGATTSPVSTKPTVGCGAGFSMFPMTFVEVGLMTPQANRSYLTGYVSVDGVLPVASPHLKVLPLVIVGYSRLFETGHALDYGVAVSLPAKGTYGDGERGMRLELRDYYTFANPSQHNIMLRVGWTVGVPD